MTTLAAGQTFTHYATMPGTLTLTPGGGGTIVVLSRDTADDASVPRTISSAESIERILSSTVSFRAEGADAEWSFSQSPVSGALVGSGRPRIGLIGDSLTGYMHVNSGTATSLINNGDGTATITFAAALGVQAGDLIGINGAADKGYELLETPCLSATGAGPFSYTYSLQGTPTTSPDSGGTPAVIYRFRRGQNGYGSWAQFFIRQNAEYVDLGIGGNRFTDIDARFVRDTTGQNLDRLVICAGINDIYAYDLTLAQLKSAFLSVMVKAAALGIPIDLMPPPPQNSTRGGWTSGKRDIHKAFRNWLAQYAKAGKHGFIDSWTTCAGTTSYLNTTDVNTNLNPSTNMTMADGVHSAVGASIMWGRAVADYHSALVPKSPRLVASNNDGNMLANGLMVDAGAGTATGWTIVNLGGAAVTTPTVVARTIAADGDCIGFNQRLSIVFSANNDQVQIGSASIHSLLTNGDRFRVSCHIKITSGSQFVKGINLYVLSQTATTGNKQFYDLAYISSAGFAFPDVIDGVAEVECDVRSPVGVHGAPSNIKCYVEVTGVVAGTAVVEVGRFTAVKAQ